MKYAAIILLTYSAALSAAPRLVLSANTLKTVNIAPGANGPTQTVQAFNAGDGKLNLTATSSASWLTASVGAMTACAQPGGNCYPINIALNTASLAAGVYTEYVTVADPNAVDSPQDIAVTVNTNAVQGSINAFVSPFGSLGDTASIPVYTSGSGVQGAVSTQSGGAWLQFLNGGSLLNYPAPYLIEVSSLPGMAQGTYTGTVVLSGSSSASDNKTINVTMTITSSPIIETDNITPIRVVTYAGGAAQSNAVTFTNLGQGSLAITGASSTSSFLTATVTASDTILIKADPTGLSAGIHSGAVTITSNAANNSTVAVPVEVSVAPAGQPVINSGGVVDAATFGQGPFSQGDILAIFGNQLAPTGAAASNPGLPPLATTLASTQVLFNGVPAPLYYVSPGQINFQVPYSAPVGQTATVQVVSNGQNGNLRPVTINALAPRVLEFFSFIQGGYGVIVNAADGSLPLPTGTNVPGYATHPAKPGDTLVVYAVGLGQTSPAAVEGTASSSSNLQNVANVTATLGGGFLGNGAVVNPAFAGLTPTAVGLYQLNLTLPATAPLGNAVPLMLTVNGAQSNVVMTAISASGK